MTIIAFRNIESKNVFTATPDNDAPKGPSKFYTVQDYPFRGYQPARPDGYQKSLSGSGTNAIVIDNGAHSTKAGWSFDDAPRFTLTPTMSRYRDRKLGRTCNFIGNDAYADATTRGQLRNAFEPGSSVVSNWDVMEGVLDYTFVKLGVDGSKGGVDRPIVMTEPIANLGYSRRTMNELMFECYSAPSLAVGIDSLFSYHYNKGTDGLVISSSHTSTHVIPVLNSKALLSSCTRLNWGGSQAIDYLLRLVKLKYPTFPGRLTEYQAEEMIRQHCYMSTNYDQEISRYLDWDGLEERSRVIQYPFTEHVVIEKTEEELARIAERKKESGRRLQEQAAKMRLEKLIKKEQELEYYKDFQKGLENETKKESRRLLEAEEFKDEAQLDRTIKELEKSIRKSRNKDVGIVEEEEVEEQTFPLLDVPDEELDEAGLKEKRHQRLMKSNVEARQRAKAEKEKERARIAEIERLDEERRENNLEGWLEEKRAQREAFLTKIRDRERLKADLGNRKSLASQMRMRTLANLASDQPKKRRRGGDDDTFGANDDDWGVYRTVAMGDDGSDDEEEDAGASLKNIEAQLLKYDPTFTEHNTLEAQSDWTKSLLHAFLRGPWPFNPESQREAHQIHLNVERIRVPEVIFQPSIAGVDQAGIVEIVADIIIQRFPEQADRTSLLKDIFLTGGNTQFHGFEERLREELRSVLPTDDVLGLRAAKDPVLDAWRGAASWSQAAGGGYRAAAVTRQEYLEKGSDYMKASVAGVGHFRVSLFRVNAWRCSHILAGAVKGDFS